jgi:hypothetical protein
VAGHFGCNPHQVSAFIQLPQPPYHEGSLDGAQHSCVRRQGMSCVRPELPGAE